MEPGTAMHEPAVLDEVNGDLERMQRRRARALGAGEPARRARAVVELRRAGGGVAAPGHARAAVAPGRADRHRLPVPRDLPLHRRAGRTARPQPARSTQPRVSPAWLEARHGRLWEQGVDGIDRYNELRKIEPMQRALRELGVNTLVRRPAPRPGRDTPRAFARSSGATAAGRCTRSSTGPTARSSTTCAGTTCRTTRCGTKGYVSIGDWHTTRTLAEAGDAEATRFFGLKRECGLHGLDG